jgi:hypothetical protein
MKKRAFHGEDQRGTDLLGDFQRSLIDAVPQRRSQHAAQNSVVGKAARLHERLLGIKPDNFHAQAFEGSSVTLGQSAVVQGSDDEYLWVCHLQDDSLTSRPIR